RDGAAVGLDDLARRTAHPSELDDGPLLDRDVAVECRPARAIDDATVLDQQVVGHVVAPLLVPLRNSRLLLAGMLTQEAAACLELSRDGRLRAPRPAGRGARPGAYFTSRSVTTFFPSRSSYEALISTPSFRTSRSAVSGSQSRA